MQIMPYTWWIRFLKTPRGNSWWRKWHRKDVADYSHLPEYVRKFAPGHSFADIGCMWGVNGEYSFIAEEAGATSVKAVDVFGPTPEFEVKKRERESSVEFILGDATRQETIARVGVVDVVFCAGVLYHHPSPFDLLVALRQMCGQTLILRTSTIPEIKGLPNAAVFFPMLNARDREVWSLQGLGVPRQVGITEGFEPNQGYGNWFWGLTPSCLESLLQTAGFRMEHRAREPFAQTLVCRAVGVPFAHYMPDPVEARDMAAALSHARVARPA
jgi:hypothetical protein